MRYALTTILALILSSCQLTEDLVVHSEVECRCLEEPSLVLILCWGDQPQAVPFYTIHPNCHLHYHSLEPREPYADLD